MVKLVKPLIIFLFLTTATILAGCSSSPSNEEKIQLDNLKKEVAQLEGQVRDKQGEKAKLEKQIAEKNGQLQQCQSEQEAVKKGMQK